MVAGIGIVACLVLSGCPTPVDDPTFYLLTLTVVGDGTVDIKNYIYNEVGSPASIPADSGETLTMTVTTPAGWAFSGWSGPDAADVTGSGPDYAILLDTDKAITATFTEP